MITFHEPLDCEIPIRKLLFDNFRKYKTNITSEINLEHSAQKPSISNIDFPRDLRPTTIEDLVPQLREKEYHFTVVPKDIMHMNNGIKYYYVEIQCDKGNFMVNAHGSEAERLFKAVSSIPNNSPFKQRLFFNH